MYLVLLIAALSESIARPIDKLNYNKTPLRPHQLGFLLFLSQSLFVGLYFWLAGASFAWVEISAAALPLALIPVFSFLKNYFDLKALHQSDLYLREPIRNLIPVITVLMAFVLFPSEREIKYVVAALLGSVALVFAKYDPKVRRVVIDRGVLLFLFGALFEAGSKILFKISLETVSPEVVLLVRSVGTLALSMMITPLAMRNIARLSWGLGLLSGFIYAMGNISMYYAIKYIGLSETIIFMFLGPAVMYTASACILKEKVCRRHVLTSCFIVCLVVITQIL